MLPGLPLWFAGARLCALLPAEQLAFQLTSGPLLAQDVRYNYAMGTNFEKYETYTWVDRPNQNHPDRIADQQSRTANETALGGKGFSKAAGDTADMLIGSHFGGTRNGTIVHWSDWCSRGRRIRYDTVLTTGLVPCPFASTSPSTRMSTNV
jgi:hypothetical protein